MIAVFLGASVATSISGKLWFEDNETLLNNLETQENIWNSNDTDLISKIKNGEDVSWEEIYQYLDKKLNNNIQKRWLQQMDTLLNDLFEDKLSEVFPTVLQSSVKFMGNQHLTERQLSVFIKSVDNTNSLLIMGQRKHVISPSFDNFVDKIVKMLDDVFNENTTKGTKDGSGKPQQRLDFEEYNSLYKRAKNLRGTVDYDTWWGWKNAQLWLLPGFTIIMMVIGGFIALSYELPEIFWAVTMIAFAIDAVVEAYFQLVTGWEEQLTVWDADIVIHVVNQDNASLNYLRVEAYNEYCHNYDDDIGATFLIPHCDIEAADGWYVMSCRDEADRTSPAPGNWTVTIFNPDHAQEDHIEEHLPVCKGKTYTAEIPVDWQ